MCSVFWTVESTGYLQTQVSSMMHQSIETTAPRDSRDIAGKGNGGMAVELRFCNAGFLRWNGTVTIFQCLISSSTPVRLGTSGENVHNSRAWRK